ncbi:PhoH family protein [Peribacillus huizhouensis]|uniref:Ribonuclease YlaK n=1 Tax=Peribacillus huizhouensis TaxID=1501239 RepID=A0ABR6CT74_9BACI|nr:PhoH family protein [Peribacillus huizhouensis]MBA9027552.1 putative ribonuclease YlaK [Peribacillus huizhouensis]
MPLPTNNMLFGFESKLTDEQRAYVDSIFDNQLTIVNAKSGTGKTTLAVACAKLIGKPLIYTFSPVEEGAMGYTPGSVEEKESKYIQPLLDALVEIREDPRFAIKSEKNPDIINEGAWITAKSHTFVRGTNIKESTLIIDESQNMTKGELKKLLTRVHDSTTVIMIGHDKQIDLKDPKKSGFAPYIEHFRDEPYANVLRLSINFRGKLAQHADELEW